MSYDGDDKVPRSGRDRREGDNKQVWDIIFKVSQLVAPLILMAMVYLMVQQNGLERRLAILEVTIRNQPVDVSLIKQLAIFEERQNINTSKVLSLEAWKSEHASNSPYDPASRRRRE